MRRLRRKNWLFAAVALALITSSFAYAQVGNQLAGLTRLFAHKQKRPEIETDGPMEAYEWRMKSEVDEHGRIPTGAWARAVHQRELNVQAVQRHLVSNAQQNLPWVERSPDNITGRSRAFLIHPTQTNRMWTAGVGGGIWYSSDSGANWDPVNDQMKSLAICCMAMDPTNPDIMYAGTGEGYYNQDSIYGAGLFKSVDGGLTWTQLPGTSSFSAINRVAISPANHNILLITVLYSGTHHLPATTQQGGIYRSSDGGLTWTQVQASQEGACVAFNPKDGTKAVATIANYDFTQNAWFRQTLYSTNSGVTWTQTTGDLGKVYDFYNRVELAYAPSSPNIVYALTSFNNGVVYKSTDGGKSYMIATTSGSVGNGQLWYDNAIWVDPTNPNFLVLCSSDTFKSTDGGQTITQIASGYILTQQPHPDNHYIVAMPGFDGVKNKTLFITTDGGPFRTDDIYNASTNGGWMPVGVQRTTQYYGAAGDGKTGTIIGGLQDNGTLLTTNGSNEASLEFGGDGGFSAIDWTDNNYLYGEYVYLQIHQSTDGGNNAQFILNGLTDAGSGTTANFIAPFVLDPNNVNRMLGGGSSVWRCDNLKSSTPTWTAIKAPDSSLISAIAIAPGNSNIIWVGQNDGKVFKTVNGTAASPTWTTIDNNGTTNPLPDRYITRILIDPAKSNTVYVALGGYTQNNLWKTADGGVTWTSLSGTGTTALPYAPIRGIARHPANPRLLYAGTGVGVYASTDGGVTWTTGNVGPANVSVYELTFMANSTTLLAATHGRGIWTANVPATTTPSSLTITPTKQYGGLSAAGTVTLSSAAPAGGLTVALTSSSKSAVVPTSVKFAAGQTVATFTVTTDAVAANTTATITATANGVSQTASLTVTPATLNTISLSASSTVGGSKNPTGTVMLNGVAATNGTITLTSSNPAVVKVSNINLLANKSSAPFTPTVALVAKSTTVTLTATYNGAKATATLTVNPLIVTGITLSPTSLIGGTQNATATVTLNAVPTLDIPVHPHSSNTEAAMVPTSPVYVKANSGNSVSFLVTTHKVTKATTALIQSSFNSNSVQAVLKINP